MTHYEERLERDIERIRQGVIAIAKGAERGLENAITALLTLDSDLAYRTIIDDNPSPQPQSGDVTVFKRRRPGESRIRDEQNLQALYDFIRMLDAEGYPRAFFEYAGFRYEFRRAAMYDGRIIADVKIEPVEEEHP